MLYLLALTSWARHLASCRLCGSPSNRATEKMGSPNPSVVVVAPISEATFAEHLPSRNTPHALKNTFTLCIYYYFAVCRVHRPDTICLSPAMLVDVTGLPAGKGANEAHKRGCWVTSCWVSQTDAPVNAIVCITCSVPLVLLHTAKEAIERETGVTFALAKKVKTHQKFANFPIPTGRAPQDKPRESYNNQVYQENSPSLIYAARPGINIGDPYNKLRTRRSSPALARGTLYTRYDRVHF